MHGPNHPRRSAAHGEPAVAHHRLLPAGAPTLVISHLPSTCRRRPLPSCRQPPLPRAAAASPSCCRRLFPSTCRRLSLPINPPLPKRWVPNSWSPTRKQTNQPAAPPPNRLHPQTFRLDPNGQKRKWQWIALLPFIDEARLKAAVRGPTAARAANTDCPHDRMALIASDCDHVSCSKHGLSPPSTMALIASDCDTHRVTHSDKLVSLWFKVIMVHAANMDCPLPTRWP